MFEVILSGADAFEWGCDRTLNAETMTCDVPLFLSAQQWVRKIQLPLSLFRERPCPLNFEFLLTFFVFSRKKLRTPGTFLLNVSSLFTVALSQCLKSEPSIRFNRFIFESCTLNLEWSFHCFFRPLPSLHVCLFFLVSVSFCFHSRLSPPSSL
jgi:hypothetical protein